MLIADDVPLSIKFARTISHRSTFQCLCCRHFEQKLFGEEIIIKLFQEIAERYLINKLVIGEEWVKEKITSWQKGKNKN